MGALSYERHDGRDLHRWPKDQVFMVLDYETFSERSIKHVGAFEYANHPSTEVLCAAWATGTFEELKTRRAKSWYPSMRGGGFAEFLQTLMDPSVILVAHNALFDRFITKYTFAVKDMYSKRESLQAIPIKRWVCTAALASARALPRSLEGSVDALQLPMKKNKDGKRLVRKFSQPHVRKKTGEVYRHTVDTDPEDFQRFVEYCEDDVNATIGLFLEIDMLPPAERQQWLLEQRINEYGFRVDRNLVKKIQAMIDEEKTALDQEAEELSLGMITSATKRDGVLDYLRSEGLYLPNLTKGTVSEAIQSGLATGDALRMLEIRQASSKTSLAKYPAYLMRSEHDGRLRDNLVYHAASTGRYGGAGLQPQNLPRGSIKNTVLAAEVIEELDLEGIRLTYGDPLEVFSSCIRNMIVASEGHVFDVADYSTVEVRVAFWLAGDEDALDTIRSGRDLYIEQAARLYGVTPESIAAKGKDSLERFFGKEIVLGCQFQMGAERLRRACQEKGREISEELAIRAVAMYRETYKKVAALWARYEKAAISAVQNPGLAFFTDRTKWFFESGALFCELPSGRRIAFQSATVETAKNRWGTVKPTLHFWAVDSTTKKWKRFSSYGGLLMQNVVQSIARDLMAAAMLRIEKTRVWRLCLTVHDELVGERKVMGEGSLEEFQALMEKLPPWAKGLPIATEGWSGRRYRK